MSTTAVLRAVADALACNDEKLTLDIVAGPHFFPSLGIAARVSFFDMDTLDGPSAELLLVPMEDLPRVEGRIADLSARARALRPEDLDRSLTELLAARELDENDILSTNDEAELQARRRKVEEQLSAPRPSGYAVPPAIVALHALATTATSFDHAALADLAFAPTELLAALFGSGDVRAVRQEAHRDFPLHPAEFLHLFNLRMDGLSYGYWFDVPDSPVGFAKFYRGETDLDETTPCEFIARAADRLEYEDPQFGVLKLLERRTLAETARFFDSAFGVEATVQANDRPRILGGIGPRLTPGDGDPRWSTEAVAERKSAYAAKDRRSIDAWVAAAETDLADGKPALALVLGRELQAMTLSEWHPRTETLLASAYRALGRDVYADIFDATKT